VLDDPGVGLINGELVVPGFPLRCEVFDPVVEQVLKLIDEQIRRADQCIDALLLVGVSRVASICSSVSMKPLATASK